MIGSFEQTHNLIGAIVEAQVASDQRGGAWRFAVGAKPKQWAAVRMTNDWLSLRAAIKHLAGQPEPHPELARLADLLTANQKLPAGLKPGPGWPCPKEE